MPTSLLTNSSIAINKAIEDGTFDAYRPGVYTILMELCGFKEWTAAPYWLRTEVSQIVRQLRDRDRALRAATPTPYEKAKKKKLAIKNSNDMGKTTWARNDTQGMGRIEREIFLADQAPSDMHPWQPMTVVRDKKTIGKLSEECGELVAAVARCLIQGIYAKEPVSGKLNKHWLEEEIADVKANIDLVEERFALDLVFIAARARRKTKHLRTWHEML